MKSSQSIAAVEQYEPPAVVELGTIAVLTQGTIGYPSCER